MGRNGRSQQRYQSIMSPKRDETGMKWVVGIIAGMYVPR